MTLKFSRNAKVTSSLTGRRLVSPAADDDFGNQIITFKIVMFKYHLVCKICEKNRETN